MGELDSTRFWFWHWGGAGRGPAPEHGPPLGVAKLAGVDPLAGASGACKASKSGAIRGVAETVHGLLSCADCFSTGFHFSVG